MKENLPAQPPSSLEKSDVVTTLLPEAVVVLQSDFHTAGIDADFSSETFADVFQLRDKLALLLAQKAPPGSEQFFRLLYRADVREEQVKNIVPKSDVRYESQIVELLVIRALQRVYFRKKFGK